MREPDGVGLPLITPAVIATMLCALVPSIGNCVTFNVGEIEGAFDSSLSLGAQWRLSARDPALVSQANGGTNGSTLTDISDGGTGDGSTNTDDGNLNYNRGLISSTFKGTHELSLSHGLYGLFIRGTYFLDSQNYDQETDRVRETTSIVNSPRLAGLYGGLNLLAQNGLLDTSRFPTTTIVEINDTYRISTDAEEAAGKDSQLLDAFISGGLDIGNHPLDVRIGRQVVSWGESTFIQNGINVINPIDVPAIRLPGAELKEALLPVNMLWAAFGVTENLTLEAFYQFDWQKTQVDEPGTYFATNDFVGNGGRFITISGLDECSDNPTACTYPNTVTRTADREADEGGQFGLALRWFSPTFNNSELGFYAINYHSRRPLISAIAGSYDDNAFITALLNNINFFLTNSIPLSSAVTPSLIAAQHNTLQPGTGDYFLEYPEDIRLLGLSLNSSIDTLGIAIGAELSVRPNAPIQIDDQELLQAALSSSDTLVQQAVQQAIAINLVSPTEASAASGNGRQGPNSQYVSVFGTVDQGDRITGYIEKEVLQAQMTAIKLFGPMLGVSQWALVGEVGFTHINLPEKNILLTDAPGTPDDGQRTTQTGFGDDFSWGYRLRARFDFNNFLNGWNMTNTVSLAHDVNGNTPLPISNFVEDRKAFEVSLDFDRQNTYSIGLTYASFWGAGERNLISDRDFAALTCRYTL
jgi:hypothetical protein